VDKAARAMTQGASIHKVTPRTFQCEEIHMADGAAELDVINASAQGKLKSLIERIERLEEDKAAVATDLKEVYAEAKGEGFDTKILRKVVRLRAQDKAKRQEEEALIDLYISAIGGL
jgi:uncharacterized protein (UPF0335 family)